MSTERANGSGASPGRQNSGVREWFRGNRLSGTVIGLTTVVLIGAAGLPLRRQSSRTSPVLALVLPVVLAAMAGGRVAAIVTALGAALVFNLVYTKPYWTPKVALVDDVIALGVFVAVALIVGTLVAAEADRRRHAEQRAAEVEDLYRQLEETAAERQRLADEAGRLHVLEQLDSQRAALLRSVSHDLRTPLATIRAVATDLHDGTQYDAAVRQELLETVAD